MKNQGLTNNYLKEYILFVKQGFAGELVFSDDEAARLGASAVYEGFSNEWKYNLLNMSNKRQVIYLEQLLFEVEQFRSLIPRSDREIEDSLTFKGLPYLIKLPNSNVPIDDLVDGLTSDLISDIRLYRLRIKFINKSIDGFATLDGIDLHTHQVILAAKYVSCVWSDLIKAYTMRGGNARAISKKGIGDFVIKTAIVNDLRAFVTGMREMTAQFYPTEKEAYNEWAKCLTSLRWWNYPTTGSWLAPIEYEEAFHNAPDKQAFLAGFRRLLDAIEPILNLPDEDNPLLRENNHALSEKERNELHRIHLHRARINMKRMRQWIQLRSKPIVLQLMEEFKYIVVIPEWTQLGGPTNILTVAAHYPEKEITLRFNMLLRQFQDTILTAKLELNLLHDQLTRLISYHTGTLTQADFDSGQSSYNIADLISIIPDFILADRTSDITKHEIFKIADDFYAKLLIIIDYRLPWMKQVLALVTRSLNEQEKSKTKRIGLTYRQVALISAYQNKAICDDERANELAKKYGLTSGETLYKKYNLIKAVSDRVNVDGQRITPMIKDITVIISHLTGIHKKQAENELHMIKLKK